MKLIPVSEHPDAARILYQLLEERDPIVNISHRAMPTWEEHLAFIASNPYLAWYIVRGEGGNDAGAVYITHAGEIGVGILKQFQGLFLGPMAVRQIMKRHPRERFLANVGPRNIFSRRMFEKLGFVHIQDTMELRNAD